MPIKDKEQRRLYNRKWMKKSRCVVVEPVEPSVICVVEPVEPPVICVVEHVEPSVICVVELVIVDDNFNLYLDYTALNLFLNKSKFNPYTIWIFKMRNFNTDFLLRWDFKQFKRKFAKVKAEHKVLSVYPSGNTILTIPSRKSMTFM